MTMRSRLRNWLKEHESTPDINEKQELKGISKWIWIIMAMPMVLGLLIMAHPERFVIAPFYWFGLWFNEVAPEERRKIIFDYLTQIKFGEPY